MPKQITRTRRINIKHSKGVFTIFGKQGHEKEDYDFQDISSLRHLLSNERARILDVIKTKEPKSIYNLAKMLGRSFKSVSDDVKTLQKFGFVEISKEKTKKRIRHKPKVTADAINIHIKI